MSTELDMHPIKMVAIIIISSFYRRANTVTLMNALLTALMKEVCSGYHGICLRNGGVDLT
jgi:hypothetical protein